MYTEFRGKKYQARRVEGFSFDDIVMINGITGTVDFIGSDKIMIVDEVGTEHFIQVSDMAEVYLLATFTSNPGSPFVLNSDELKKAQQKT